MGQECNLEQKFIKRGGNYTGDNKQTVSVQAFIFTSGLLDKFLFYLDTSMGFSDTFYFFRTNSFDF
jgi:hypothetical protein